jgi:hypothetical protein
MWVGRLHVAQLVPQESFLLPARLSSMQECQRTFNLDSSFKAWRCAVQVAALSQTYQEKIDSMRQTYEKRKTEEQARLQRGEKILMDMVSALGPFLYAPLMRPSSVSLVGPSTTPCLHVCSCIMCPARVDECPAGCNHAWRALGEEFLSMSGPAAFAVSVRQAGAALHQQAIGGPSQCSFLCRCACQAADCSGVGLLAR